MPYEVNLPEIVIMYLQLIERILTLMNGLDSSCHEYKMFSLQVGMYLDAINAEMTRLTSANIEAGL